MTIDIKMVPKNLVDPLDLSGAQKFYNHKFTKIVITYEKKNVILAAF